MRAATPALIALLNGAGGIYPVIEPLLYTFILANGNGTLYYTTSDFRVTAASSAIWNPPAIDGSGGLWSAGIIWQPNLIALEDGQEQGHWRVGLDSDGWNCVAFPRVIDQIDGSGFPDQINGVPFAQAVRGGALDSAEIIVARAYFASMPTHPVPLAGVSPVGTLIEFRGRVGKTTVQGQRVEIPATDYRAQLNRMMPRNLYQAQCRHQLFDSRCTLTAATFTKTGVAAGASTPQQIVAAAPIAAPGGSNTFTLGVLTMTSGLNAGLSRMVSDWDGAASFSLLVPFAFPVAAGDTFSVAAGCDKRLATCQAFSNSANFGGEPFLPMPEVSAG